MTRTSKAMREVLFAAHHGPVECLSGGKKTREAIERCHDAGLLDRETNTLTSSGVREYDRMSYVHTFDEFVSDVGYINHPGNLSGTNGRFWQVGAVSNDGTIAYLYPGSARRDAPAGYALDLSTVPETRHERRGTRDVLADHVRDAVAPFIEAMEPERRSLRLV